MYPWKKKLLAVLVCGALSFSAVALPAERAEAVDAWAVAAQSLGIFAAYKSSLASILALGNDVSAQVQSARQDLRENGEDDNHHDVEVVNRVMKQLIDKGDYVLKVNSLPFVWGVNNSNDLMQPASRQTTSASTGRSCAASSAMKMSSPPSSPTR